MTTWTWMVYMATNNDAEVFGAQSIANIETATANAAANSDVNNVRVLVQQATSTSSVRRIMGATPEIVSDLGKIDSADPATILDFVRWAVATVPAQRYALIIWSHGTGWQPGEMAQLAASPPPPAIVTQPQLVLPTQPTLPSSLPQVVQPIETQPTNFTRGIPLSALASAHTVDEGAMNVASTVIPVTSDELTRRGLNDESIDGFHAFFSTTMRRILHFPTPPNRAIAFDNGTGHALDTIELGNVMEGVAQILGQPVDLLGMNACLMSSIEVAYQVRSSAHLYVASENLMPVNGWPYDDILSSLRDQPDIDSVSLGKLVVEKYCAYFGLSSPHAAAGVTLTALRLASIDRLASAVSGFANALQKDIGTQAKTIQTAQNATPAFHFRLYDLANFCHALMGQSGIAPEIVAAAQEVVAVLSDPAFLVEFGHVNQQDASGGVSTYLMPPLFGMTVSPYYAATDYAKATGWGAFLTAYLAAIGN